MSITSANRLELLQIADAVAPEKLIDPDLVIEAMEESMAKAAKSRYGAELDIRAHIDRKSGALQMTRLRHVVEELVDVGVPPTHLRHWWQLELLFENGREIGQRHFACDRQVHGHVVSLR